MTIGEVARRSNIAASAIRFYEQAGVLPKPARRSGRREYDASILERLAVLERCKACGFTIEESRRLFFGFREGTPPSERWRTLAQKKLAELQELQAKIAEMRALLERSCRCSDLSECGRRMLVARSC
jgi:MerR family redox-sensitive transcriptional activator SoxR